MNPSDQVWIAKQVFANKAGQLVAHLKLMWHPPPPPPPGSATVPVAGSYFLRRFLLWMPRKMWKFKFTCPKCRSSTTFLTSKGLYNRVRIVIGLKDRYYLATEYLECRSCTGTFLSYDARLLAQLPFNLRALFPVVMTRKFAADESVVALMRARTLGNSPTAVHHDVNEIQTEEWMRNVNAYLADCSRHKRSVFRAAGTTYEAPPPYKPTPTPKWFLGLYVRDCYSRLDLLKASATSVYGTTLKIDSTKKITQKLQGVASKSAAWCTNVGNERGEVLVSILTTSECLSNLKRLADGLMNRYQEANHPHPTLLYTDRECCREDGGSKFNELFDRWPDLKVRLDSWHFIRRLSKACVNESHPLYGTFMAKISASLFAWDDGDVQLLLEAKKGELKMAGVVNPSPETVRKAITKSELAKHCRRKTRPAEETTRLLEELFASLGGKTDTLGVPLFRDDAMQVWEAEKRHVSCLQDPEGYQLYTQTGVSMKGGITLPVLRCARGTTSLESFHSHLKGFIPGKWLF